MRPYCHTNEYQVVEGTCFDDILIRMKEMAQDDRKSKTLRSMIHFKKQTCHI